MSKTVWIGSASIDERGKASGGKAGDQSGTELRRQAWYLHPKGWRVLRLLSAEAAERTAAAMEAAIANRCIGYDQGQRMTLYRAAEPLGFDPARVSTPVECDCSSLVRVCLAYAGVPTEDFTTSNEASRLLATGRLRELTGGEYTDAPDRLRRGDILVTATRGHTVVTLSDGSLAARSPEPDAEERPAPADPVSPAWIVTRGRWWLRKRPARTGAAICAVPSGSHVRVLARQGDWLAVRVRETGREGYMHRASVSL